MEKIIDLQRKENGINLNENLKKNVSCKLPALSEKSIQFHTNKGKDAVHNNNKKLRRKSKNNKKQNCYQIN